jgi:serine/threonine protein kinase
MLTASLTHPNPQSKAQLHKELHLELQVLGSMQHKHIVTLLGWCPEENALVFELAENGTLGDCLPQLDWVARTRIATEVCRGLVYLHLRCVRSPTSPTVFVSVCSAALGRPSSSA